MERTELQSKNNQTEELAPECNKECRKRAIFYLSVLGLVSILALITGFILNPYYLQKIWLVFSGTLSVLCGIAIYIFFTHKSLQI